VNKLDARRKIGELVMILRCQAWLLDKCNHSHNPGSGYAHHVRDRISESIVSDLKDAIEQLEYLRNAIDKGIHDPTPEEQKNDKIPF
jgi:hypothetical protein